MAFLDLAGLTTFKNKCDERYAYKSHTHTYSQISDAGTHVYDATISRTAGTVLAAPARENGVATFRKLNTEHFDNIINTKASVVTATNWNTCYNTGWYVVSSSGAFTGAGNPKSLGIYRYGQMLVVHTNSNSVVTQLYLSHLGEMIYRQAWSWKDSVPVFSSWYRVNASAIASITNDYVNSLF